MSTLLRQYDCQRVRLDAGPGAVLVSPGLQGRIFCTLGDELIHRLDAELLATPLDGEFNNLGGNSLWPAPEGGLRAFNYAPGKDDWYVQDGIATQPAGVVTVSDRDVHIAKDIRLVNRQGVAVPIEWSRRVTLAAAGLWPDTGGLAAVAYSSADAFRPLEPLRATDVLIAPWSLEQFPGGNGVTAFAKVFEPDTAVNFDFYGMPDSPPMYGADSFTLPLGGTAKFQLGIKANHEPLLLGALDRERSLLILRRTPRQDGTYFNIADNDQPDGPWSAADMYSVFNGGELGFFELETIAPMQVECDRVAPSILLSHTLVARGSVANLAAYVGKNWDIML